MKRPQVGELFEAYFAGRDYTELSFVVEWRGRICYFSNGYYLIWGGESVGFMD